MVCQNCGCKLKTGAVFCHVCGAPASQAVPPVRPRRSFARILIPVTVLLMLAIGAAVWYFQANSLENRLMEKQWWSEIYFQNRAYDFSDSEWWKEDHPNSPEKGYWVDGRVTQLRFFPHGTIRDIYYVTPVGAPGTAWMSDHEVTEQNYSPTYTWNGGSGNRGSWSVWDDDTLEFYGSLYKWSEQESNGTWYMTGDTLRIGTNYYTARAPRIYNTAGLPPYWCANCGESGPYDGKCPNCDSKEKITE